MCLYDEMLETMPSDNFILSKAIALLEMNQVAFRATRYRIDVPKKGLGLWRFAEYYTKMKAIDLAMIVLHKALSVAQTIWK